MIKIWHQKRTRHVNDRLHEADIGERIDPDMYVYVANVDTLYLFTAWDKSQNGIHPWYLNEGVSEMFEDVLYMRPSMDGDIFETADGALWMVIGEYEYVQVYWSETFTQSEVTTAVEQFLGYGENTYDKCHKGYFNDHGWAARCLRYHLKQLENDL